MDIAKKIRLFGHQKLLMGLLLVSINSLRVVFRIDRIKIKTILHFFQLAYRK